MVRGEIGAGRSTMTATVKTVVGTGAPGCSDTQVNDPFGLVIRADGALYFCEVGNQMIRRLDLQAGTISGVAGNGERQYAGDGGPATGASMNMPHELCFDPDGNIYVVERDSHAVRKIDRASGTISTVAGTGEPGSGGDGGPATEARLRIPHSIAFDANGDLLICDIGNHRIRRLVPSTGIIDTYAGTGATEPTP